MIFPSMEDVDNKTGAVTSQTNIGYVPLPQEYHHTIKMTGKTMSTTASTGHPIAMRHSHVTNTVKEVTVVPDERGKYGFKVEELDDCIFINFISSGSPAQANGLRFGDQVLHVNGNCAFGRSPSDILKQINDYGCKVPPPPIVIAVRERPLERTITMHKDSEGYLGFQFKFGRIDKIHDESSAARNGLMKNQNITEVNGINVVGLEDEEITKIITDSGNIVTVTIMDPENYKILLKSLPPDMVRKYMDRSINID